MSLGYTWSQKTNRIGCCWKRRSRKTMVTKSSKVVKREEPTRVSCAHGITATLIVWTESNGTDMALSFQEADGCAVIWLVIARRTSKGHILVTDASCLRQLLIGFNTQGFCQSRARATDDAGWSR